MEFQRYVRQMCLPGIGERGQRKLARARVLIVGMGGLGCPSSLYLASAGVGTLGLADFDAVETSNLHRQVLYIETDVGASKVDRAAAALQARNPTVHIERHDKGITADQGLELVSGYDLVLDGTDNFATRYLVNDAAVLTRVPLVSASLFQFEAQLAVFDPASGGPCYRCIFPQAPASGEIPNCAEAGVFGALPGTVGAMQAMEAIKWITGVGEVLRGRLVLLDLLANRFRRIRVDRDPGCPVCGDPPRILRLTPERYTSICASAPATGEEIDPAEAAALADALFLDVREPCEWEAGGIAGAKHIPLRTLADRWDALPRGQPIVVYCQKGARSLEAVRNMRRAGFELAVSLAGGMDRWYREQAPGARKGWRAQGTEGKRC